MPGRIHGNRLETVQTKNVVYKKSLPQAVFGIDVAAHGDLSNTKLDASVNLEVIALGHSRTGTTSLQLALTKLGFGPSHQGVDLFRSLTRTNAFIEVQGRILRGTWQAGDASLNARLRDLMHGYRSTTDIPINFLCDEMYAAYPRAKFILSTRPDGREGWWRSLREAVGWHMRHERGGWLFRFCIWPVAFLRRTDDLVQQLYSIWLMRYGGVWGPALYDTHNAHVRSLIPRAQLLEFDVREGWEPLCSFLNVPIPDEPFPRLNDSAAMQAIYFGMMAYGVAVWPFYAGVTAGGIYLTQKPELLREFWTKPLAVISSVTTRIGR